MEIPRDVGDKIKQTFRVLNTVLLTLITVTFIPSRPEKISTVDLDDHSG
jgi:hypothetical protein